MCLVLFSVATLPATGAGKHKPGAYAIILANARGYSSAAARLEGLREFRGTIILVTTAAVGQEAKHGAHNPYNPVHGHGVSFL